MAIRDQDGQSLSRFGVGTLNWSIGESMGNISSKFNCAGLARQDVICPGDGCHAFRAVCRFGEPEMTFNLAADGKSCAETSIWIFAERTGWVGSDDGFLVLDKTRGATGHSPGGEANKRGATGQRPGGEANKRGAEGGVPDREKANANGIIDDVTGMSGAPDNDNRCELGRAA